MTYSNQVVLSIANSDYLYQAFEQAFKKHLASVPISNNLDVVNDNTGTNDKNTRIFHYGDYEQLNVDKVMIDPNYFVCSYIYRKALIRKHYLAHTIHSYVVKHPDSILSRAFPETYQIEVDYAEFLDDALDECYELRDEINSGKKTWILKPSMSDKGQGIRVFKTLDQLQAIFDSFENEEPLTDDEAEDGQTEGITLSTGVITSQLRHFVVQEYLTNPLLLKAYNNRKFHIRCYVLCSGALKVYVYKRMLALFAANPYNKAAIDDLESQFNNLNLNEHLTNTCLQGDKAIFNNSVSEFAKLEGLSYEGKEKILNQIYDIVKELYCAGLNVDRFNFQPLSNALEFYGLDFLVDENHNVTLLEVNAYPDFKQTGKDLKSLVYELIDGTVNKVVSPFFGQETKSDEFLENLVQVLDQQVNGF